MSEICLRRRPGGSWDGKGVRGGGGWGGGGSLRGGMQMHLSGESLAS